MLAIGQKLDQLAEFHRQLDMLEKDKQKLIDQVLPPEIKARLEEIEAEFAHKAEAAQASIETLEGEIKSEVISHGESVRGAAFQAVWTKGRQSWDGKGLTTYSESHPDILQFRKEGEPSVAIRRAASKDND
jgi:phage terminase small subunit